MKKYAVLSFDDGPNLGGDTTMSEMLDVLASYSLRASFFLIGNKICDENIPVIKRAVRMGCDIENHSWFHLHMDSLSAEEIREEYARCDKAIFDVTGRQPEFFRPPYISVSQTLFDCIDQPFICGKDCRDWEDSVSVEERLGLLLDAAEDGVIFLLHVNEGNSKTVELVRRLVPLLLEQGYEFLTLPQLFDLRKVQKKNDGNLWSVVRQARLREAN